MNGPVTGAFTGPIAYILVGIAWLVSGIGWAIYADRLGKRLGLPNDGCLLAGANVVFAIIGGALGLFVAPYPYFLLTSLLGALLLPALATTFFATSNRKE